MMTAKLVSKIDWVPPPCGMKRLTQHRFLIFYLSIAIGATLTFVLAIYPLLLANNTSKLDWEWHLVTQQINDRPMDIPSVNNSLTSPVPVAHRKFLFAITHQEQLTSSSRNFIQLLQLAQRWQKRVPEPFICENRMVGFPHICTAANSVVRYSLIFNLSDLAYKLKSPLCNISGNVEGLIAPADKFLQDLAGNTTLLYFLYEKHSFPSEVNAGKLQEALREHPTAKPGLSVCTKEAEELGVISAVETIMNQNRTGQSRMTNVVCVDPRNISFDEIMKLLTDLSLHEDNIVLLQWRTLKRLADHVNEAHELHVMCKNPPKASPSPIVFHYSQQFLNSLKLRKPFLSLHMRTEKLLIGESKYKGYIDCCMNALIGFLPKVMSKYKLKDVLLIRDYSSHGTDSCTYGDRRHYDGSCRRISDAMMFRLEALGLKVVEFIPAEHGAPEMSGLAARVEAVTLAQGAAFVGVGGGTFQHFIQELFHDIHRHDSQKHMYRICMQNQPCSSGQAIVTPKLEA